MKAKLFSLMLGLVAFGHAAHAQNTGYKMNVKMTDGSFFSVPADDVSEVYFTTTEEKQFTDTYYRRERTGRERPVQEWHDDYDAAA